MHKKILITGSAGFIGFHVAQKLKERGDSVVGIDNFNDYYSPALKQQRADLLRGQGIETIEGDVTDRALLSSLCAQEDFTHILHLAAQAGVRYALHHPDAYLKSNLEGFLSILETCRLKPSMKLVYASSSSVYGQNEKIPFSTTDRTDHPANLYAATKKANELMAYSYHHLFGIPSTALRYFTVYGPWGRPDMAYYRFTEAILEGKPIHLFNSGKMQRDFTYIDDAVAGTILAIDYGAPWEVFNIGNNHPEELLTFVALIEKTVGKKAHKIGEGPQPGEVEKTYADISEAERKLGYSPKVALSEGLPLFIDWFQEYRQKQLVAPL